MRSKLAVCILNRKILLVVAHDGDQYLFRQCQILRIEVAENHARPFRQMHHCLDELLVLAPACAGDGPRRRVQSFLNRPPALGHVNGDKCLAQ